MAPGRGQQTAVAVIFAGGGAPTMPDLMSFKPRVFGCCTRPPGAPARSRAVPVAVVLEGGTGSTGGSSATGGAAGGDSERKGNTSGAGGSRGRIVVRLRLVTVTVTATGQLAGGRQELNRSHRRAVSTSKKLGHTWAAR